MVATAFAPKTAGGLGATKLGVISTTDEAGKGMLNGIKIEVNKLGGANFQEFVIGFDGTGKTVEQINKKLLDHRIFGGKDLSGDFPFLGQAALFCITEKTTCEQIRKLADALTAIIKEA